MNTPDSAQIGMLSIRPVWQWLAGALVIAIECCLLQLYKNGLIRFSTEHTIRTYLDAYGGQQFWLATHMGYFFKIILYFLTLIAMVW